MPKLFGEMIKEGKMRVDIISYSGNKEGGVEVDEVLEGDGIHYVDPSTGRQWFEPEGEEKQTLEQKIDKLMDMLGGGGSGEMGD